MTKSAALPEGFFFVKESMTRPELISDEPDWQGSLSLGTRKANLMRPVALLFLDLAKKYDHWVGISQKALLQLISDKIQEEQRQCQDDRERRILALRNYYRELWRWRLLLGFLWYRCPTTPTSPNKRVPNPLLADEIMQGLRNMVRQNYVKTVGVGPEGEAVYFPTPTLPARLLPRAQGGRCTMEFSEALT